jgi:hypothetical protein
VVNVNINQPKESSVFVAWRDLRFAKGRFVLIGTVVTLITLLVGFLTGLTAGLANQSISAVTSSGVLQSLTALGSFRSEIGSLLLLMVAMLFGISALVVGAFFTVWSIQRQLDVAVLKALGASNRMLVTHDLHLLPRMESVYLMVDGELTASRETVSVLAPTSSTRTIPPTSPRRKKRPFSGPHCFRAVSFLPARGGHARQSLRRLVSIEV